VKLDLTLSSDFRRLCLLSVSNIIRKLYNDDRSNRAAISSRLHPSEVDECNTRARFSAVYRCIRMDVQGCGWLETPASHITPPIDTKT
jgi:hypothetical protein